MYMGVPRQEFYQAEDGIRDVAVTGVQTCALPIYAKAFTSSKCTCGWYLIPPLNGPRASLYCTRYPKKTFIDPSSIATGIFTSASRAGFFSCSTMPASISTYCNAFSNCANADLKGDPAIVSSTDMLHSPYSKTLSSASASFSFSVSPVDCHTGFPPLKIIRVGILMIPYCWGYCGF